MKILIFGEAGFLGHHLREKLEKKHEVFSVDNFFHSSKAEHKSVYGDIRDKGLVEHYIKSADVVFFLAAQIHVDYSIEHPQETIDINVSGTLNVLEACRKFGKKLIFASSSEVYGSSLTEFMDENHPTNPQSPYAASKLAGDALCRSYIETYGMDIAIIRNFNTFGEWQNDGSYGGVIAIFTRQALKDEPLTIYGSGEQERDYMFVDDAIQAYELSFNLKGVYNFGTGKTVKIKDLALMIKEITNSQSEIIHLPERKGEVQRLCAGIEKAKSIGFNPATDFKKDLTKYILWNKQCYKS